MAQTSLKIKALPVNPKTDLDALKEKIKQNLENAGAKITNTDEQEIAFGLKAIITTFVWPEEKDTEEAEKAIQNTEKIKSTEILDYRRIS